MAAIMLILERRQSQYSCTNIYQGKVKVCVSGSVSKSGWIAGPRHFTGAVAAAVSSIAVQQSRMKRIM